MGNDTRTSDIGESGPVRELSRGVAKRLLLKTDTPDIGFKSPKVLGVDFAVLLEKSCNFFFNDGRVVESIQLGELLDQSLLQLFTLVGVEEALLGPGPGLTN